MKHGFFKVAAASPVIKLADAYYNAQRTIECIKAAEKKGIKLLAFSELSLIGASCYDLVKHRVIVEGAKDALIQVKRATKGVDMLVFVGLPYAVGSRIYSVAAVLYDGHVLGLVPREQVDGSHFQNIVSAECETEIDGDIVPVCPETLFESNIIPGLKVAVELGADMDAIVPPSVAHCIAGASIVVQMASFPCTHSSTDEATLNAKYQSKRQSCGIVMAAPGKGESSTDNVFSGLCLIAENGVILASDEREDSLAISEIDVEYLMNMRRERGGFDIDGDVYESCFFGMKEEETQLSRTYYKYPHIPEDPADLPRYCKRVMDIQVSGLVKRMQYAGLDHCVVGISGGSDSTLAVMICAQAVRRMGLPAENVIAVTLPCFGTTSRTKSNAIIVAEQCGAEVRVVDISKSVLQHFDDIGHAHDDYSIAFENAQARERTQVLMDIGNKVNGMMVGTEDLSEFVDGWCTYNGDHTSMYDVNLGLTKTQVRANLSFIAARTEDKVLKAALYDVLDCPITPELLPVHDDIIEQKSEDSVGSYSLQDFFTHKMLICGFTPEKTLRLATTAYASEFTPEELHHWLTSYCKRYFSQQFKRSCLMDGPAVESFSVSPRNGHLIPSDAENTMFLRNINAD